MFVRASEFHDDDMTAVKRSSELKVSCCCKTSISLHESGANTICAQSGVLEPNKHVEINVVQNCTRRNRQDRNRHVQVQVSQVLHSQREKKQAFTWSSADLPWEVVSTLKLVDALPRSRGRCSIQQKNVTGCTPPYHLSIASTAQDFAGRRNGVVTLGYSTFRYWHLGCQGHSLILQVPLLVSQHKKSKAASEKNIAPMAAVQERIHGL